MRRRSWRLRRAILKSKRKEIYYLAGGWPSLYRRQSECTRTLEKKLTERLEQCGGC